MIYLIEPQCYGVEHSLGNAAILHLIKDIYPKEEITFFAEDSHLTIVKNNTLLNEINYFNLQIPTKGLGNIKRFKSEIILYFNILRRAKKHKVNKLIFTSITTPGLVSLKLLSIYYSKINYLVIPHSILENLYVSKFTNINDIIFNFNFWFKNFNSKKIKYILLGKSIENNLLQIEPNIINYSICFDLPYLFSNFNEVTDNKNFKIFGYLGSLTIYKGGEDFLKLTNKKFNNLIFEPRFQIIGRVFSETLNKKIGENVQIMSQSVDLTRNEFDLYLSKIDYCIFCFPNSHYKLRASGTIFDSISYLKPIISLRNDFFEYYFKKFGNIGYLCDSIDEIYLVISSICQGKLKNQYNEQVANLKIARDSLQVKNISKQIQDKIFN